ncbi:MAG: acyltransferase [Burkholderiales bacterium]|nr:acyltransferase [Burkholderiales bacterium]
MNRGFSLYLDIVRFSAACLVYLSHSNKRWLVDDPLPASGHAHAAVIVFFVLSGYVIAYVTDVKERVWHDYLAARLSRIYSVALPAVFLTIALDAAGRTLYPDIYGYPFDQFATRISSSLLFLNEVWFVSITSFSNVPYWSVCYELWYYVLFGILMFAPRKWALVLALGLLAVLGPKIALLAPIWILGALLYHWKRMRSLSYAASWALVIGSTLAIVGFTLSGAAAVIDGYVKDVLGAERYRSLVWSWHFLSDYVLAILFFAHLAGMRNVAARIVSIASLVERPIRFLASYTFTLYLLHQPLFLFWASVIRGDAAGPSYWILTTGAVGISVVAIGYVTEHKRYRVTAWIRERLLSFGIRGARRLGVPGH